MGGIFSSDCPKQECPTAAQCPPKQECPPAPKKLGLKYTTENADINIIMESAQEIVDSFHKELCDGVDEQQFLTILENEEFKLFDGMDPYENLEGMEGTIEDMIIGMVIGYISSPENPPPEQYKKLIENFIKKLIQISLVDGTISLTKIRENIRELKTSLCRPENQSDFGNISKFGSVFRFGSISKFGSMDTYTMTMLLLVFIVLAVLVYYFYMNGKNKMSSFNMRMYQFGKTIKSLRRRR